MHCKKIKENYGGIRMIPIIIAAIESPEDRELMIAFYTQYENLFYLEANKLLSSPEDVSDIVQEALAKAIDRMDTFRALDRKQQLKYMLVSIRNLSINLLKHNGILTTVPLDTLDISQLPHDEKTPEAIYEEKSSLEQLRTIWGDLDEESRTLLLQKYELHWTDAQLADQLGIQPQSVRMRLTRAKKKLAEQIRQKGLDFQDFL